MHTLNLTAILIDKYAEQLGEHERCTFPVEYANAELARAGAVGESFRTHRAVEHARQLEKRIRKNKKRKHS